MNATKLSKTSAIQEQSVMFWHSDEGNGTISGAFIFYFKLSESTKLFECT